MTTDELKYAIGELPGIQVFQAVNVDMGQCEAVLNCVETVLRGLSVEYSATEQDYSSQLLELADGKQWLAEDVALPERLRLAMAVNAALQLGYMLAQHENQLHISASAV